MPSRQQTPRAQAKAERRRHILTSAAELFAERGFHAVRLEDIAARVGITGPAIYRYFPSKEDALAQLLLDVSTRLRDDGRAAADGGGAPSEVVDALLAGHVDFVVEEPELITVQYRDLHSVPDSARRAVQDLQREYVAVWADALGRLRPELSPVEARARVHAVFGLLNSSPRLPTLPNARTRSLLAAMARAALEA